MDIFSAEKAKEESKANRRAKLNKFINEAIADGENSIRFFTPSDLVDEFEDELREKGYTLDRSSFKRIVISW